MRVGQVEAPGSGSCADIHGHRLVNAGTVDIAADDGARGIGVGDDLGSVVEEAQVFGVIAGDGLARAAAKRVVGVGGGGIRAGGRGQPVLGITEESSFLWRVDFPANIAIRSKILYADGCLLI